MTSPAKKTLQWTPPEIMLAILFLLAPLYYHPNLGGEGLRIPSNITAWSIASIFIFYAFYLILKRSEIRIPKYFVFILAFPILATISGFIAGVDQPIKWAFKLLFIWGGVAFFIALYQETPGDSRKIRFLGIIVLSALVHAIVGILQFWLKGDMIAWLPVSESGFPTGLFQQINNHATYQVTAILIVAYLISKSVIQDANIFYKSTLALTAASASFIVFASGSRVGLLSLIVALPILLFLIRQPLKHSKKLLLLFITALVIGGVIGGSLGGASRFADKLDAMKSGFSGNARLSIYAVSIDAIKASPIVGHGLGSFAREWQLEKADYQEANPDKSVIKEYVTHPHNEVFMWLVEGGVITVVGLVIFLVGVLYVAFVNKQLAFIPILIPIAFHTQLELPFYTSAVHWFLFALLISFVFSVQSIKPIKASAAMSMLMKVSFWLITIVTMFFLSHSLIANYELSRNPETQRGLALAQANPYFENDASRIYMTKVYSVSLETKNSQGMQVFADWMEEELKYAPYPSGYKLLIHAHQLVGKKDKACRASVQASRIYPSDNDFSVFASQCRN